MLKEMQDSCLRAPKTVYVFGDPTESPKINGTYETTEWRDFPVFAYQTWQQKGFPVNFYFYFVTVFLFTFGVLPLLCGITELAYLEGIPGAPDIGAFTSRMQYSWASWRRQRRGEPPFTAQERARFFDIGNEGKTLGDCFSTVAYGRFVANVFPMNDLNCPFGLMEDFHFRNGLSGGLGRFIVMYIQYLRLKRKALDAVHPRTEQDRLIRPLEPDEVSLVIFWASEATQRYPFSCSRCCSR